MWFAWFAWFAWIAFYPHPKKFLGFLYIGADGDVECKQLKGENGT